MPGAASPRNSFMAGQSHLVELSSAWADTGVRSAETSGEFRAPGLTPPEMECERPPERGIDILTGQPAHGELLAELLQAGPLAPELVLRYAIGIGKALGRVHDRGVVHGSLSPWSIVVGDHKRRDPAAGGPDAHAQAYTSPEQIRGEAPGGGATSSLTEPCCMKWRPAGPRLAAGPTPCGPRFWTNPRPS